jgi:6,7-dimethyl-8-ribityllumazine synthase
MLKPVRRSGTRRAQGGRFAIVASKYNQRFVDTMLRHARAVFANVPGSEVHVVRVPGAFEIPVVASKLAGGSAGRFEAVICLGVILRGETTHAQHIGEAVSAALAQIQIQFQVPVIHEVLLLENEEQAKVRCLGTKHNRGAEAAATALEMARVLRGLCEKFHKELAPPKAGY